MKKKLFALICPLMISLAITGCERGASSSEPGTDAVVSQSPDSEDSSTVEETPAVSPEPSQDPQQDSSDTTSQDAALDLSQSSQPILDWNGLSVTAEQWDPEALTLEIHARNSSDTPVTIQVFSCTVNDYVQSPTFSLQVEAQSSAQGDLTFSSESFSLSGISSAAVIQFTPVVLDGTNYNTLYTGESVTLSTGSTDTESEIPQGQLLSRDSGISVYYLGQREQSTLGTDFLFYIENTSGNDVALEAGSCLVNGISLQPLFSVTIPDQKKSVSVLSLFTEDLEENGITQITSLSVDWNLLDPEDYHLIGTLKQLTPDLSA